MVTTLKMKFNRYKQNFLNISKKNLVVGLSGTIGSGKSTALKFLNNYGCITLSSDEKSRLVLTNKKNCDRILSRYPELSDQGKAIDRKKLARLIFNDKKAKQFVEDVIHPSVVESIVLDISKLNDSIIVIEVPLMFETGFDELVDLSVVITADRKNILNRLLRRGMSKKDAERRLLNQLSDSFKIDRSDVVIANNGDIDELESDIKMLYEALIKLKPKKE